MSDVPGRLRSAADHLDDARTDLEYGDLGAENLEHPDLPERIDGLIGELDETLRTLANMEELKDE